LEYIKHLLNKEKIKMEPTPHTFVELYEMVGNQQEIKNVIKKALTILKGLTGEVSVVQYVDSKFVTIGSFGDKEKIERFSQDRSAIKWTKDHKKPFLSAPSDEKFDNHYIVLPLVSKDEFLGALCIHREQPITMWDKIGQVAQFLAVTLKFYALIDANKNIDIKDVVTDLFNHKHFHDQLDLEAEKSRRYRIPLSLVVVNISDFKKINQTLGFDAGDDVLKQLGTWIAQICRRVDMPARLDADTFAVLLSNTDETGARVLLDRILIKINNNMVKAGGHSFKIKVRTAAEGYSWEDNREEFLEKTKEKLQ
jgi:diguanylate cyclase (GGDEF)-like protein